MTDHPLDLLGVYALDAIGDDTERAAVERHLEVCGRCRDEVDRHLEVLAVLSMVGGEAPPNLWDELAQRLDEVSDAAAPAPGLPQLVSVATAGAARPTGGARWRPQVLVAAAAAVPLILGLGAAVVQQNQRIDRIDGPALQRAYTDARDDQRSVQIALQSTDGALTVPVVMVRSGDAFVHGGSLPRLPKGHTYQLWGMVGERPVSLAVLGGRPGLVAFHMPVGVGTLAVTDETNGPAVAPTQLPLVSGQISA